MDTESVSLSISKLTDETKHVTNEMLLVIQRYRVLTDELLKRLEQMTNRAIQAEYHNKLIESVVSSGAVLNEITYHKLINGDQYVAN